MPTNKHTAGPGGPGSDHDIMLVCMDNIKHNLDFPDTRQHQQSHIWMLSVIIWVGSLFVNSKAMWHFTLRKKTWSGVSCSMITRQTVRALYFPWYLTVHGCVYWLSLLFTRFLLRSFLIVGTFLILSSRSCLGIRFLGSKNCWCCWRSCCWAEGSDIFDIL